VAPLTAVALAAFFLGERIGVTQVFGIAAVILAILTLALPVRAQTRL